MKRQWAFVMAVLLLITGAVSAQEMDTTTFTVRIENVSGMGEETFGHVGIFGIPEGDTVARAVAPGEAYEFWVRANSGDYLSFASMYGQSNDTFVGTYAQGIAFYDEGGNPVNGDVTDQVALWDAGTEVNEPLGQGANQAPRQTAPNTGETEGGVVQLVDTMSGEFAPITDLATVTLTAVEFNLFRVRIENHSDDAPVPTPFSPLVYVVHSADQTPLFTEGEADRGQGLERIAEDGNPQELGAALAGGAAMNVGASPGVYVVHSSDQSAPFFTTGEADRGQGLEQQAEDGNPDNLGALAASAGYKASGVFDTPVDASERGALMQGQAYEFTVEAVPGDVLNFALMFGQSNDLFFAPGEDGIPLFTRSGNPVNGVFTGSVGLWNAGTEVNQEPFVGADQAPRQAEPNTGESEGGVVQPIVLVNDGFDYPSVLSSLRVTITNDSGMDMNMMADAMMMDDSMMPEATMDAMMEEMTPEAESGG